MSLVFEKLTPKTDAKLQVYKDAFGFVFLNNDIKNVAISGAYGAGKSSILESYKRYESTSPIKKERKRKYVHISLAHFEDAKAESNDKKDDSKLNDQKDTGKLSQEALLEGKILNQLIHQIKPSKIPQTHFRVKRTVRIWSIILHSTLCFLFFAFLAHIVFYAQWSDYINTLPVSWIKDLLLVTLNPFSRLVSGVLASGIGGFLIFSLVKAQTNKNIFRKLNVNGTEIEIFENSEESYFDKYLNEVLYLFEQVDADVIVFEDIDRYDDVKIFERLREVNTLINLQPKRKGKTPLRFFYLLRDDIFVSKDRTKFFDFIIPIVHVVDGSNAYNQFKDNLTENHIFDKFDPKFLQGVSLYVDEMRLLKNICNEFLVYFNRMTASVNLNYNKMFAMVVYKNLFPRDFCELQLRRGFVAALFANKSKLIEDEINAVNERIECIKKQQEQQAKEVAKTKSELNAIFKERIHQGYRNYSDWIQYLSSNNKTEYDERLRFISDPSHEQEILQKELADLKEKLVQIRSKKLSEIITRDNIERIFALTTTNEIGTPVSFNDVKTNNYFNLLKYLIRNGYIDETYSDYMTYFYPNTLSNTDKNYLISVTDRVAKEYSYELKAPNLVFESLRVVDFEQEETLNFSLLEYMLKAQATSEQLSRLVAQIRNEAKYDFLRQYYELNKEKPALVQIINNQWPDFWNLLITKSILPQNLIKDYSINSLYYSDDAILESINIDKCLTEYISNDPTYLNLDTPDVSRLIDAFKLLGVKFNNLNYDVSSKDLFVAVYNNSLYTLNFSNIKLMLEILHELSEEDILHSNYTHLLQLKDAPIFAHVSGNMEDYMHIILEFCDGDIRDTEIAALELINIDVVSDQTKQCYITCLSTKISDICSIQDKKMWKHCMGESVIASREQNAFEYYAYAKSIDETLLQFVNEFETEFVFKSIIGTDNRNELIEKFAIALISSNKIDNKHYKQIVNSLVWSYEIFEITGIDSNKINLIIDAGIIIMNAKNLNFIRENYPEHTMKFVRQNIYEYIKIMDASLFVFDELIEILSWDVEDKLKLTLLDFTDDPISIIDKDYTIAVKLHILKYNRHTDDIRWLYQYYNNQLAEIKEYIYHIASESINIILENEYTLCGELHSLLIRDTSIDLHSRVELFLTRFKQYDKQSTLDELKNIGVTEFQNIFEEKRRPKCTINKTNRAILDAFAERNWIAGYEEDEKRQGYYKLKKRSNRRKNDDVVLL